MILTEEVLRRYRANQGYVYLVHAVGTDRYKIGRSVNPVARFEILKKQSPYPLQIVECFWTPDAIADEAGLHYHYAERRAYGEWFDFKTEEGNSYCVFIENVKFSFESWRPTATDLTKRSWGKVLHPLIKDEYYRSLFDMEDLKKLEEPGALTPPLCLTSLFHRARSLQELEKVCSFAFNNLPELFIRIMNVPLLKDDSWYLFMESAIQSAALIIFGEMV